MTAAVLPGYVLDRALGCGSMGTVHLARRVDWAGRLVAIKRVPHAGAALARTLRHEAEVLAALDHPHIVRILDLVPDGDGVAIAMQYAAGGSVPDVLARRGRLTAGEVVAVAAPVADALASAHRRGLLHCDVKPANILFTSDGEPLLSDFGLARSLTAPHRPVVGTAEYLDPAVAAGGRADERSDVYGLGAVCYEMMAGIPPYSGATPDDVVAAALTGPPLPLTAAVVPGTPAALVDAVERAMAPSPDDRFAGAAELAAALRASADPTPLDATRVAPGFFGRSSPHSDVERPKNPDAVEPTRADDSGRRPTRTFGPRPPTPPAATPRPAPMARRRLMVAAGAASVLAATVVAGLLAAGPGGARTGAVLTRPAAAAASRCPAVAGPRVADADGDGCPAAVTWEHNVAEVEGRRYELGRAGDALLVGDWDCDGSRTPALYRPATGEVFRFDGWAEEGQALPATDGGRLPAGGVALVQPAAGGGCDRVVVRTARSRHA